MQQFISNPIIVEAGPVQELLAIVKAQQELPSSIQNLFIDGRVGFGEGVMYVEGLEAQGDNWVVYDAEEDQVKVMEDAVFRRQFSDGEEAEGTARDRLTQGAKDQETPPPASPPVSVPAPVPSTPVPTAPATSGVGQGPVPSAPVVTNYQAPQQEQSRHEPRPAQNLDGLKG